MHLATFGYKNTERPVMKKVYQLGPNPTEYAPTTAIIHRRMIQFTTEPRGGRGGAEGSPG